MEPKKKGLFVLIGLLAVVAVVVVALTMGGTSVSKIYGKWTLAESSENGVTIPVPPGMPMPSFEFTPEAVIMSMSMFGQTESKESKIQYAVQGDKIVITDPSDNTNSEVTFENADTLLLSDPSNGRKMKLTRVK